jgi:hypothetical protein
MPSRFFVQTAAAAAIVFVHAANLLAIISNPATVQEFPTGPIGGMPQTQYTVNNTSSDASPGGKFDFSIFLSTTTGSSPTTTNSNWTSEVINATDWTESMGFPAVSEPANPTWQQYTGMTYTQVCPFDPTKVNGYYLDYTFNSDSDTISFPIGPRIPGVGLGGFFFAGSPSSTFFVAGPADPNGTGVTSLTPGDVVSYTGTSTDVPEPAGIGLVAFAVCGLASRRLRRGQTRQARGGQIA